jgi:hypothetical protein
MCAPDSTAHSCDTKASVRPSGLKRGHSADRRPGVSRTASSDLPSPSPPAPGAAPAPGATGAETRYIADGRFVAAQVEIESEPC